MPPSRRLLDVERLSYNFANLTSKALPEIGRQLPDLLRPDALKISLRSRPTAQYSLAALLLAAATDLSLPRTALDFAFCPRISLVCSCMLLNLWSPRHSIRGAYLPSPLRLKAQARHLRPRNSSGRRSHVVLQRLRVSAIQAHGRSTGRCYQGCPMMYGREDRTHGLSTSLARRWQKSPCSLRNHIFAFHTLHRTGAHHARLRES